MCAGLIAADSINMVFRIVYSGQFVAMSAEPAEASALLRAATPTSISAFSLFLAFAVTGLS